MACRVVLNADQRQWFSDRKVAWEIVNNGKDDVGGPSQGTAHMVLEALLANMGDYGAANWTYEPGSTVHADNTLKGHIKVTDCDTLAEMFRDIAKALGYTDIRARKIAKDGYRMVTSEDLVCFTGKAGDKELDGRWCFGDHWVVDYNARTFDPTFVKSYNSGDVAPSFGWWAREERTSTDVFTNTVWKADGKPTVYLGLAPPIPARPAVPARPARKGFCGIGARPFRPGQPAQPAVPGHSFFTFKETNRAGQEIDRS